MALFLPRVSICSIAETVFIGTILSQTAGSLCSCRRHASRVGRVGDSVVGRLERVARRDSGTLGIVFLVGLDPGGVGAFGWCVVEDGPNAPLRVRGSDVADDAVGALEGVNRAIGDDAIAAAGIDAPLLWVPSGDRRVDGYLREAICRIGASSGTVNHVNSLRGACLAQGMLAAMLLRRTNPRLPLTEAHPKAMLWMLGVATTRRKVANISAKSLSVYFDRGSHSMTTDHERDAALAALGAWAMIHRPAGWEDIRERLPDHGALTPLAGPVGYWVPRAERWVRSLGEPIAGEHGDRRHG